jgi:hypothetical protein
MKDFLNGPRYTEEELMARLKFFVGVLLGLTLFGIVFVVLYSIIFVVQPLGAISPVDQKFFELIIPIATFLTGTLSGIMLAGGDKDLRKKAMEEATKEVKVSAMPTPQFLHSAPESTMPHHSMPRSVPASSNTVSGYKGKAAPQQPPHEEL